LLGSGIRCQQSSFGDVLDQFQAAQLGQSGILIHPDVGRELTGGLAISSLLKPLRVKEPIELHT
jgi:hypothetical protein